MVCMGLVMVKIKLINYEDVRDAERGLIAKEAVRTVAIEALAVLGAVQLELMDLVVVPSTGEVVTNPEHPNGPEHPLYDLTG